MLWIALHLPLLSLESFAATLLPVQASPRPQGAAGGLAFALVDAHHVVSASPAAQALGVKPGIQRATALALAPQLLLGQADAARDAQALTAVAHAALAFTPSVSLQPALELGMTSGMTSTTARQALAMPALGAHTVLLEVQASLRFFGGREALLKRLADALAPLGHRIHRASAPTPQGAALLARVHRECHTADLATARRALEAAPVWLLGPGREHWDDLQGMGLRTLADLKSLPRVGLARRFGEALLDELDRAFGDRPDPREPIALPPRFESRLELFARADSSEQVLHGAHLLLLRLVAWLSAQHAFVRRFTLVMQHEARWRQEAGTPNATLLEIALAESSRDAGHLLVLLRERLAQVQLPAPALELRLEASDIARRAPANDELFPTPRNEREGLVRLIERLQARLGAEQVQQLVAVADHRPECASTLSPLDLSQAQRAWAPRAAPGGPALQAAAGGRTAHANPIAAMASNVPTAMSMLTSAATRPVWLLPEPQALPERASGPVLDGQPLRLLSGPERIEAGWWDAELAERDYFIAQAPGGALVWIYRARLPLSAAAPGWFLQGRFG